MKTSEAITNSAAVADRSWQPGAGVDPKKVIRIGKRIRNLHRHAMADWSEQRRLSLKEWVWREVNALVASGASGAVLAKSDLGQWLQRRGYDMSDGGLA
jgi:hypothetical protein